MSKKPSRLHPPAVVVEGTSCSFELGPQGTKTSSACRYKGSSKLRTHTVLGPYGRSVRSFLRAVRVITFEQPV